MAEPKSDDVFLNGKAQVIEMLRYMRTDERERLIREIRLQSETLADELSRGEIGFNQIANLSDEQMNRLFDCVEAPILGMAIKGLSVDLQKKILSLAERSYAEEAYQFMTMSLSESQEKTLRAREKMGVYVAQIFSAAR